MQGIARSLHGEPAALVAEMNRIVSAYQGGRGSSEAPAVGTLAATAFERGLPPAGSIRTRLWEISQRIADFSDVSWLEYE